jgi:hypothetical protein
MRAKITGKFCREQCYNHCFGRFLPIFLENIDVCDLIFSIISCILARKRQYFLPN